MRLSVLIPAANERAGIAQTVRDLDDALRQAGIDHEILVVDDHSTDGTGAILDELAQEIESLRPLSNDGVPGFGKTVVRGFEAASGDAVAIVMADGSDSPADLVRFFQVMEERGVDCVFGSRFIRGANVVDYPRVKLVLNRLANTIIRLLFGLRYNDVTNAFKIYRRHVIEGLKPFLSHHFNLTVELPLKAIVRGYSYTVLPNSWENRREGVSKFGIQEMGSRYVFIVLYCLLERWLSRGDYRRN